MESQFQIYVWKGDQLLFATDLMDKDQFQLAGKVLEAKFDESDFRLKVKWFTPEGYKFTLSLNQWLKNKRL